jgi:hypothetical protein
VFLSVQQNILDYLHRQKDLLGRRQYYLNSSTALVALQNYFDWEERETLKAYAQFTNVSRNEIKTLEQEKNLKSKYENLYNKYYEGEATLGGANESEFIERRLEQINFVLEKMEKRQRGALEINAQLGRLSIQQIDFLIDLMIQLRGTDLLGPRESSLIGQDFADLQTQRLKASTSPQESEAIMAALVADYQFYSMLQAELNNFDLWLAQKKRLQEGQAQDLKSLRQRP